MCNFLLYLLLNDEMWGFLELKKKRAETRDIFSNPSSLCHRNQQDLNRTLDPRANGASLSKLTE